ncbi:phage tail sheath subtilisin-like domain-containing protein [Dongia soli]|uniref:Phage tail sheath C-terminal domain-containing protein n=1 Tax=Dongia soli TaxID=600628 RepID=A0ABU5E8W7_9PROT|nr:phage tail sheath subtilisin-like domain-containing protein [Dongia soli]MDY0882306.1 phage tail sheath C-terminal domain-containing protein [Dongia soli]
MGVSFNHIDPATRVPLFYAELDNSQASYYQNQQRALLIAQMLPGGTAEPLKPILMGGLGQEAALFGAGSHLARMVNVYRQNDAFGEIWCLPMPADEAAVEAEGTITIAGVPTAGGTIYLYIANQLVKVKALPGDSATVIATALKTAINALTSLPVTAASEAGVITLTATQAGLAGNDIDLRINLNGAVGGETTPAGITITIEAMSGGTGAPDVAAALAAKGDEEFDFVGIPYTDAVSLNAIRDEWDEETGCWSWLRQVYGHVFSAKRGTVSGLQTFGITRNDPHVTIAGYNDSATPPWEVTAAWVAQSAVSLRIDPARPLQTLPLVGVSAPPMESRFSISERQTLLTCGVATSTTSRDGVVHIERAVTTYQRNAWGQPDPSYLDVETLYTLAYVLRFMKQAITQKYGRHKLANDGTAFGPGQAMVTPKVIKAEIVAQYRALEEMGLVENTDLFKANLIVERAADNPNRINVLYPPDLVNQLRIFAVLAQFRLQYPAVAA